MIKKSLLHLFVSLALLCSFQITAFAREDVQEKSVSQVVQQANSILLNLKITRYSHKTEVDEKKGIYILDCSSLACYILGKVAPNALAAVQVDSGHNHARAKNFYDTFSSSPIAKGRNGWMRIIKIMETEPGDFIAWRKNTFVRRGNTGHVVIVLQKPVMEENGNVRLVVMDASRSGHSRDTRKKGESGVGVGVMWFKVDEHGAPKGVLWSSRAKTIKYYPIAIGRVVP